MDWYWIAAITVAITLVYAIASKRKEKPRRIRLFTLRIPGHVGHRFRTMSVQHSE